MALSNDPESLLIKGVGAPLRAALAQEGITSLAKLNGRDYQELLALHGVGKTGLGRVLLALRATGGDMTQAPAPDQLMAAARTGATITEGHTCKTAKNIKTRPTSINSRDFIESLPQERRVSQRLELLELFKRVTGQKPVKWGPTMIGYGEVHYRSDSVREGDWFKIGFSQRAANLTLYGLQSAPNFEELVGALGRHKLGASCVYITNLDKVDREILEQLVSQAWTADIAGYSASGC